MPLTVTEIAQRVGGELAGDGDAVIVGVAPLELAGPEHLAFVDGRKALQQLGSSRAGAVLVDQDPGDTGPASRIVVENVRLALARALELFHQRAGWPAGIDASAQVDATAQLGEGVSIGPLSVVGAGCEIGRGAVLDAGVVLYPGVKVGADCWLQARAVLREGTVLGDRVILQPAVVLGADGFGYAQSPEDTHVKIPQCGTVMVEDDVEIGAGTCIDRGTLGVTRIRRGSKIDNLVQIGHNCDVGEHAIVCGQVGIAGSCVVEHHVMLGGQVGLSGHLTVGAGSQIGAQSGVHADIAPGSRVIGSPPLDGRSYARTVAAMPRLPDLLRRVRRLEAEIEKLQQGDDSTEGGS